MHLIAYQGESGAYSEEAVLRVCGAQARPLPQPTFAAVFQAVAAGEAEAGVVPVENSYAGRIAEVILLLQTPGMQMTADLWLPIHHCLLCLPGQYLGDIRRVLSHPQALAQCDAYLRGLPVEVVDAADTAGSARLIREQELRGVAAIASRRAAEVYGLAVLAAGIETSTHNRTHFVAFRRANVPRLGRSSELLEETHAYRST